MADVKTLAELLRKHFKKKIQSCEIATQQVTVELSKEHLTEVCLALRDEKDFSFEMLIDVCGVDYLEYGVTEWATDTSNTEGYSRGVDDTHANQVRSIDKPRFAVVYHLLSLTNNHRVRLKVFS